MSSKSLTRGIDHVGLTVRDLQQTRDFFIDCLGWEQVGEKPDYPAVFVSDGYIRLTLWACKNERGGDEFDRKSNVGLHHLALRVESEEALKEIFERIEKWPGTKIEFSPELLGKGPKMHTMLYEPGGIRLEFDYDPAIKK
jgi:catechol 2,3-dioxygenase-like lactoylglutathione lyase family enzyme